MYGVRWLSYTPRGYRYGNVYFLLNMLATRGIDIAGKRVAISGSGNVALFTAQKLLSLGAKVVSMSDSDGSIYVPDGLTAEQLERIFELKLAYRARISEFAKESGCEYYAKERPWRHVKCDIAMPSATQNEIDGDDARALLAQGVVAVSEGANMPSTPEAVAEFVNARILYAPAKPQMPEVCLYPVLRWLRTRRKCTGLPRRSTINSAPSWLIFMSSAANMAARTTDMSTTCAVQTLPAS